MSPDIVPNQHWKQLSKGDIDAAVAHCFWGLEDHAPIRKVLGEPGNRLMIQLSGKRLDPQSEGRAIMFTISKADARRLLVAPHSEPGRLRWAKEGFDKAVSGVFTNSPHIEFLVNDELCEGDVIVKRLQTASAKGHRVKTKELARNETR